MMKILVTGGAGFIGSHVVDSYISLGHDVVVLDNLRTGFAKNINPKATFVNMDIRAKELDAVFAEHKPEIVGHFAAQMDVRQSLQEPLFDADCNVLGSINLLECCVRYKTRKIIYASTGGAIYGEPEALPADESYQPNPLSHYGLSKFVAEEYIRLYRRLYNLDYTILRFPNVYGPRQNPHGEAGVCAILIALMLDGKVPTLYGHGEPLRDYVYVGDIARANVLALDQGSGEIVNLGSNKGTSVRELYDVLSAYLGFNQSPNLAALRAGEVERIFITGDHAAKVLGWVPEVGVKEGLHKTADYIRAEGC